jgi:hypothetical protein
MKRGQPTGEQDRLNELKREIALREYEVDAGEIAEAIVRKLRLIKLARRVLDGDADRSRRRDARRLRAR